jgi:hypothetical protein
MVPPGFEGSVKLARHEADTFLAWKDAHTSLQAELYIYSSATATVKIQIPNLKLKVNLTDDDATQQDCSLEIGRNGLGSNYTNSNMAFTSPARITVVNS